MHQAGTDVQRALGQVPDRRCIHEQRGVFVGFGRIDRAAVVDLDASCPLGRCMVTAHELQSLRSRQTQTDVPTQTGG